MSYQATVFTPADELVVAKVLSAFYPAVSDRFDADPTVLPPLPAGAPKEVPRIFLAAKTGEWRLEIAASRVNVHWQRQSEVTIDVSSFFGIATDLLSSYKMQSGCSVTRLAGLVNRFARMDQPGLFLASHFCKETWLQQPLNRPESFELHSHKRFKLANEFHVNSWARSKTGFIPPDKTPVILFEQDINTVADEENIDSYDESQIARFYAVVATEVDTILRLYFPNAE